MLNRYLAGIAILAVVFLSGLGMGWSFEHDKFVAYKSQIDTLAKEKTEQVKLKDNENEEQTRIIAKTYDAEIIRLRNALTRLRNDSGNTNTLPTTPEGSQSPYGASCEQCRTCEGTEFYENALKDALKVQMWQEWAIRQRIPVE